MSENENAPRSGNGWLKEMYLQATAKSDKASAYGNVNKQASAPEDVHLAFEKYITKASRSRATGEVLGRQLVVDDVEVVYVPKGSKVVFYRRPEPTQPGISIATIFTPSVQVTIRWQANPKIVRP